MAMASSEHETMLERIWRWVKQSWMSIAFFVGFFLFWEFSISLFNIPLYILTPPSMIVTKAWADLPRLVSYTYITALETILGYVVAIVIAMPLGLAIAFSSILRRTVYPFFVMIEMVPKIAFAPLFISWLGFGLLPKVIIVFLVCFFPIVLNAILAFSSLSEELQRFSRSTGAGVWRTFMKVRLPAALPQCFVGLKYAGLNATVGAAIAEFIGSDQGLGFYIQITTGNMRPELAFAGIFFLTGIGLVLFGIITLAEKLLIPWHISVRQAPA